MKTCHSATPAENQRTASRPRVAGEAEEWSLSIRVIRPGDGEMISAGPFGIRIIEDGSHTGHRLGLVEATLPPGPAHPPQHIHSEHDEVFIVTAGKIRFTSGDVSIDVEAGSVVVVPPGVAHTFANPFDAPAAFLGTMTPDLYIQYFRDLAALPTGPGGILNPADVGRVMSRYATEVVRPG
jgi:mannose-6-phosphate isomerase-like protein (cupin superfamily)